ncbi:SpoIID/LytB domain-containing protein [Niallia taxi]|uniref:SpoIID/LytB domain-containing protein n=1 Tax=Niallia taxi TaxID=2499688 RepID=UPI002E1BD0C2|nr:SpoIID/LytB domain-containing protein [Niallia taxi]MED4037618.1 SpoIID/LytB domain-containing protein [Niallia taxi]
MIKLMSIMLIFVVILCAIPQQMKADSIPMIEVKLVNYLGNKSSITVVFNGDYTLTNGTKVSKGTEAVMSIVNSRLKLATKSGQVLMENETSINATPAHTDGNLAINDRGYYGSFQFVMEKDTKTNNIYIRPINKVDVETYLRGVVPQEMPALWSMEALKAQTVAARTYALKNKNDANMVDTIAKQVYGGIIGIHPRSDNAIQETAGMVLKYNNSLIDAVFSASNGGKTEVNSSVWGGTALPYFAVVEDAFDFNPATKDKFPWAIQLKQQQLPETLDLNDASTWWVTQKEADANNQVLKNMKTWLKNEGYIDDVNTVKIIRISKLELNVSALTSGGRVSKGTVNIDYLVKTNEKAVEKKTLVLNDTAASRIRAMVGIDKMPSYLVDVSKVENGSIYIQGRGNGHGVGLSQYGARNRADAGQSYQQILQFYFPKAALIKEYSGIVSSSQENTTVKKDTEASVTPSQDKKDTEAPVTPSQDKKDTEAPVTPTQDKKDTEAPVKIAIPAKKDTAAPVISAFKASSDYKKNRSKLSMKINKSGKMTIAIKDSKGKIISTLAKNKAVKSGVLNFDWNISKVANGTYTAEMTAENLDGYKKTIKQKVSIQKPAKEKKGSVKATVLNMREKATTASKVITRLKKKQTVVIVAQQGSWYKVKYGSKTGYVSTKYITVLK